VGPVCEPGSRDGLTKSQAEARLRRIIEDTTAALAIVERVTMKEAGDRLLAQLAALGRKRATAQSYESILRVHLAAHFAEQPLAKIARQDVEAFIGACRADGQSVKSTLNYLGLLHGIFEYALREEWVAANPCKLAAKPRAADTDIHYLDADELEALIRAAPADDLGRVEAVMYLTAATTGTRSCSLS
jgi:integrase